MKGSLTTEDIHVGFDDWDDGAGVTVGGDDDEGVA